MTLFLFICSYKLFAFISSNQCRILIHLVAIFLREEFCFFVNLLFSLAKANILVKLGPRCQVLASRFNPFCSSMYVNISIKVQRYYLIMKLSLVFLLQVPCDRLNPATNVTDVSSNELTFP